MRQIVRRPAAVSAFLLLLCASYSAQAFASPHSRILPVHPAISLPTTSTTITGGFRGRPTRVHDKRPNTLPAEAPSRSTATALALSVPRAGAFFADTAAKMKASPASMFDVMLVALSATAVSFKALERIGNGGGKDAGAAVADAAKPRAVKSLQLKYLLAFWALRTGYWMSGPYVYAAYASKVFNGVPASLALVSKIFLSGFMATALIGPSVGKATDQYGRKKGTLAFAVLYAIGVLSVKSDLLWVLFAGRAVVGVALSLLFCAPESWLGGEAARLGLQDHLGETFSLAYEGDSLVAIAAGKLAGMAAHARGPTGPFDLSVLFLAVGAIVSGFFWKENSARDSVQASAEETKEKSSKDSGKSGATIADALDMIRKDPKLLCVGAVQSLFEAAMYVFILQWPPAMGEAVATAFGGDAVTPFGTIFSCFMSCSLLGSILFGQLNKKKVVSEDATSVMLAFATLSMAGAALSMGMPTVPFAGLVAAFFIYEACVGMYFPAMGTLRAKLVPESHRSLILSVFGIPLNLMVVAIFLSIKQLGVSGALGVSAAGLALATASMLRLRSIMKSETA